MFWLFVVSLIWAFSFGLIKTQLAGLDSSFVSFIRLFISFMVFLPFLSIKNVNKLLILRLFFTGMIQYGLMYLAYIYAYHFLAAYETALFTIFTPLYITVINDLFYRKFHKIFFIEAVSAVLATAIIVYFRLSDKNFLFGFILIQISNASFAFGQVYYKRLLKNTPHRDLQLFAVLYGGAVVLSGLSVLLFVDFSGISVTASQFYALIYLGIIASGMGFFLWNYGARRTNAGTLAVFNNLKIPMAIVVSLLFFGETADIVRLLLGSLILIGIMLYNEFRLKSIRLME